MPEDFPDKGSTHEIIGAAMEVHRTLGPGFLESVYHNALAEELTARGVGFKREYPLEVQYRGAEVGHFEADFLASGKVAVELKAAKALSEVDEAQVMNYPRASGIRIGLLLNFGERSLVYRRFCRLEIRVICG